jgi:oligoribonuclease
MGASGRPRAAEEHRVTEETVSGDAAPAPRQDRHNLVWIDLEMTGLDPADAVIIEVASLITDGQLNVLAEGPAVAVHRPGELLAGMDEWNTTHHAASGLLERVKSSTTDIAEAQRLTLEFVRAWVPERASPLCGNSISHDRRFLRREMPQLDAYLHYRNIDVSTVKELVRRWYPGRQRAPEKRAAHRALDDIHESLQELAWYREHVFAPPDAPSPDAGDAPERVGEPPTADPDADG